MTEKKVKVAFPTPQGPLVDGSEVSVAESTERWSDVKLEDGTELRLKSTILGAIRVDGQYDAEGNPVYMLKANPIMVMVSSPYKLHKGGVQ